MRKVREGKGKGKAGMSRVTIGTGLPRCPLFRPLSRHLGSFSKIGCLSGFLCQWRQDKVCNICVHVYCHAETSISMPSTKVTKGNSVLRQILVGSASGFARIKCKCLRGPTVEVIN